MINLKLKILGNTKWTIWAPCLDRRGGPLLAAVEWLSLVCSIGGG